jgi:DNA-binding GntR family transcriptional regulator
MRLVLKSLHQEVASTLREQIFAGRLATGSFLDEDALCTHLTRQREALRELARSYRSRVAS